jgi:hypothetical protein
MAPFVELQEPVHSFGDYKWHLRRLERAPGRLARASPLATPAAIGTQSISEIEIAAGNVTIIV